MSYVWIISSTIALIYLVFLVAFCFWFLYLLQNIIQKRSIYKVAMRNIQYDQNSLSEVYRAETELVKNIFLFIMNIAELLSITIVVIPATIQSSTQNGGNYGINVSLGNYSQEDSNIYKLAKQNFRTNIIDTLNNKLLLYCNTLGLAVFVLSLTLITSLCTYLTARYANKSWIQTTCIPYYIAIVVITLLIMQVCTMICSLTLVTRFGYGIFQDITFLLFIRQSKKLKMVLNWTIVDLRISKRNRTLRLKLERENRKFTRLLHVLWTGLFLLLVSEFILQVITLVVIVKQNIESTDLNLCSIEDKFDAPDNSILLTNHISNNIFYVGISLVIIPYVFAAYYTLCVAVWRRVRGRTGYRTHFRNPLLS